MDGIVVVNKEKGMTSFKVVSQVRNILNCSKAGHTGTLDPDAEGVLPVCINSAVKCSEFLVDKDKEYIAKIKFGSSTDTQDASGSIINKSDKRITLKELSNILHTFIGKQTQKTPAYSAVSVNGHRLHELARKGRLDGVSLPVRTIEIYSIDLLSCDFDKADCVNSAELKINCSKGTYIRTLCNDIGERTGCFAHMSGLIRTKSGKFSIDKSVTLNELKALHDSEQTDKYLISTDEVLSDFKSFYANDENIKRFINGIPLKLYLMNVKNDYTVDECVKLFDESGNLYAVSKVGKDERGFLLKPYKLFFRGI